MRSLNRKAQSKVQLLTDFVVPHKISYDSFFLEKIKKLAEIRSF